MEPPDLRSQIGTTREPPPHGIALRKKESGETASEAPFVGLEFPIPRPVLLLAYPPFAFGPSGKISAHPDTTRRSTDERLCSHAHWHFSSRRFPGVGGVRASLGYQSDSSLLRRFWLLSPGMVKLDLLHCLRVAFYSPGCPFCGLYLAMRKGCRGSRK